VNVDSDIPGRVEAVILAGALTVEMEVEEISDDTSDSEKSEDGYTQDGSSSSGEDCERDRGEAGMGYMW
jgi:hypothetical protein